MAQQASSAVAQQASSAIAQQASSALVQQASSAKASSATYQAALVPAIALKESVKNNLNLVQSDILGNIKSYSTASGAGSVDLPTLQNKLILYEQKRLDLINAASAIFKLNPNYQDPALQTVIPDNTLSSMGVTKVFDALRNGYIFLDSNNNIISNPITPASRSYATQGGGRRKGTRKSAALQYRI
jgi:hypothetical protein